MLKLIKNFRKNENGDATVDWVVLTSAVAVLVGAAYTSIKNGSAQLTSSTGDFIRGQAPVWSRMLLFKHERMSRPVRRRDCWLLTSA